MRFHYIASQLDGKIVEGDVETEDSGGVLDFLGSKGLKPISIKELKTLEKTQGLQLFSSGISATDQIFLTKYLSLMLKVGTDLLKAMDILIADFQKPAMKAFLLEVKLALSKGQPFYVTFEKYKKIFSPVFVNLVKAGEVSGNLEMVFENLNVMLEKEHDLKRKIKAALTYPIILMVASFLVLFFLITFALPKIAELFYSSGFNPPLFSRIVFGVGLFLGNYFLLILSLLLVTVVGGAYFFFYTVAGKRTFIKILEKVPVVKDVVEKVAVQRFATTFSSLMRAGLPVIESLNITADAIGNERFGSALKRIASEGVARGLTLGDAFRKEEAFPQVIVNLVGVSEKAGHLDEILRTLADFYESEIEGSIKILVSFIEPVMLAIIGLIIGTIALSIIVPIYQLVSTTASA